MLLDEPNAFLDQAGEAALVASDCQRAGARSDGDRDRAPPRRPCPLSTACSSWRMARPKMIGPAKEVVAQPRRSEARGECSMSDALVLASPVHSEAGDPRREIRLGAAIAAAFFVVFLGWAAFVPLDAGVHAPGTIAVAGNRQTVQHRDGGVVTAIHVREGQHVRAGEVLVELSAPELKASERALDQRLSDACSPSARACLPSGPVSRDFAPPPEFATLSPARPRNWLPRCLQLQRREMHARRARRFGPAVGAWPTGSAAGAAAGRVS